MVNKKELLREFFDGKLSREQVKTEVNKTGRPIIVFTDGDEPENPYNRPIIRFGDTSKKI